MTEASASAFPTDFLEPWKLSDVILLVEDQKFHVHRSILAFWSPVFEKMFTSGLKEKNNDEIPLPGKKASEIKHLLLMLYPSLEEKPVTKANCYFLLELAHEYLIESIVQKCQSFMVFMVREKMEDVFAMLIYGQKYQLKTLILASIDEAQRSASFNELIQHKEEIEPDNYLQITEQIIQRLEPLEPLCREVKEEGLQHLESVVKNLCELALEIADKSSMFTIPETTDERLDRLLEVFIRKGVYCESLTNVASALIALKAHLQCLDCTLEPIQGPSN